MPALMTHPFGELLGLKIVEQGEGTSRLSIETGAHLHNPLGVVHGGVICSLADTGMAAALYPTLKPGEICATIDISLNFFKPVSTGLLTCDTKIINRGKRVAHLESNVYYGELLVAKATGNFSILVPSSSKPHAGN